MQIRSGALIQRDVKNEGWTDYLHENRGGWDKMCTGRHALMYENAEVARYSGRSSADRQISRPDWQVGMC